MNCHVYWICHWISLGLWLVYPLWSTPLAIDSFNVSNVEEILIILIKVFIISFLSVYILDFLFLLLRSAQSCKMVILLLDKFYTVWLLLDTVYLNCCVSCIHSGHRWSPSIVFSWALDISIVNPISMAFFNDRSCHGPFLEDMCIHNILPGT